MTLFDSASVKEFGTFPLYLSLTKNIGIASIVDSIVSGGADSRRKLSHGTVAELLVLNRLTSPTPLYRVEEWAREFKIDKIYGIDPDLLNDDRCARTLSAIAEDSLLIYLSAYARIHEKFERIARSKAKEYKIEVIKETPRGHRYVTANLDSTNLSFYGVYEKSDFVAKGYSNDHHIDLKQIRVQLITLRNGLPMFHMSASGNSVDKSSLKAVITQFTNLLERVNSDARFLDPSQMSLVIDRGYATLSNLTWLDDAHIRFIAMAAGMSAVTERILSIPDDEFVRCKYGAERGKEYRVAEREFQVDRGRRRKKFRMIVVWSKEKERNDLEAIEHQVRKYTAELEEVARRLNRNRYKKVEYVRKKVNGILGKMSRKYKGLIVAHVGGVEGAVELEWEVSQRKLDELRRLAGKYALLTNWPAEEMSGEEALSEYKSRGRGVEWVFKELKSELGVRPIYLRDEERIGALVMLTMIALLEFIYIYNLLRHKPRKGSFTSWLKQQFSGVGYIRVTAGESVLDGFTKLNGHQVELLGELGLEPPPPFA